MKCETALPKNIRQIGEIQQNQRVYLEDYVMTFLHKKEKEADQEAKSCFAGILLGNGEWEEEGFCIFIRGAVLTDAGDGELSRERLEEAQRQSFPDLKPVGCFVIGMLEEAQIQEMMGYFEGTSHLIYHVQEGEETVYLAKQNEYERLKGYFIFYERNPGMQKYMTEHCREQQVEQEEGNSDEAMVSFRRKVKEKTAGKDNRGMRYLASSFLLLTVLVLGVTIIQNYDKIQEMEAAILRLSQEQASDGDLEVISSWGTTVEETEGAMGEEGTETESIQTGAASGLDESTEETEREEAEAAASSVLESWQEELLNQEDAGQTSKSARGLAERNYSAEEALDAASLSDKTEEDAGLTGRNGRSVYTVKYGDTLADISVKYYGTLDKVEEICELNQIDDANLIVPGEKIVLP